MEIFFFRFSEGLLVWGVWGREKLVREFFWRVLVVLLEVLLLLMLFMLKLLDRVFKIVVFWDFIDNLFKLEFSFFWVKEILIDFEN